MIEQDKKTWVAMLAHLRKAHPAICRQWFEELEPLGIDRGTLYLRAHSLIHRDYLQRQCVDHFREAAQAVSGHLLAVTFLGPEEEFIIERKDDGRPAQNSRPGTGPAPAEPTRRAAEPLRAGPALAAPPIAHPVAINIPSPSSPGGLYSDSLVINPDYSFDHFVVGPGNRLAHAAALAVATNPGRAYNPYFVHGDVGLGKTHLLQAICLQIRQNSPGAIIYYTSCEGFMTQFMEAVQAGEMTRFRHKFRDVNVLVIDDIHFLAKRDRTQEEFFHTFNSLYQAHKQIVLSSDAPPGDIPDLEDRLVSRFKWGLVANVAPPDYETRIEILKNKARMRGFELPDDVAAHISAKIDSNIRELEGAIVKLQIVASVDKRPIDMELARSALGEEPLRTEKQIQIQTIVEIVTDFYAVKVTELQSKRRHRSVALPRQVCMYLARRRTLWSLEQIGRYFGGRDHTTVMHAIKTIEDRCQQDTEFAQTMLSLEERVREANQAS